MTQNKSGFRGEELFAEVSAGSADTSAELGRLNETEGSSGFLYGISSSVFYGAGAGVVIALGAVVAVCSGRRRKKQRRDENRRNATEEAKRGDARRGIREEPAPSDVHRSSEKPERGDARRSGRVEPAPSDVHRSSEKPERGDTRRVDREEPAPADAYRRSEKPEAENARRSGPEKSEQEGARRRNGTEKTQAQTLPAGQPDPGAAGSDMDSGENLSGKEPLSLYSLSIGKVHDVGMRGSQQDSFGLSSEGRTADASGRGVAAVVADGMGGLPGGENVSARVTLSMLESFERLPRDMDGSRKLSAMLNQANADVNALLGPEGLKKSGSTVAAVLVQEKNLYWISVGDSHIYLYRNHSLFQINCDHVYGTELDERAARGEISAREAAENPQRRALTSYIGMGRIEKTDRNIRPFALLDKDRILLMSDGVYETLTEQEILAAMQLPAAESCDAIHQMIKAKALKKQDNYTSLVLEYRMRNASGCSGGMRRPE